MQGCIVNLADLEFQTWGHGQRFEARLGAIGSKIGAEKLGYNLTVLPPGKRAFPFHSHRFNEEMFFVVEGEGEIRIGGQTHKIRKGDVIACPPGGPETAHQIVNTSAAELKYLAVSTMMTPEIAEYPDSGKVGVLAKFPPGPDGKAQQMRVVLRGQADMQGTADDYWQGE
jgi:uncharacterized cupin superfamily protein